MRKIRLSDENKTEYEVTACGADDATLFMTLVTDEDLLDTALMFGHSENVETIEHYFEGTDTDHVFFTGFTSLYLLTRVSGKTNLMLNKGATS